MTARAVILNLTLTSYYFETLLWLLNVNKSAILNLRQYGGHARHFQIYY